MEFHWLGWLPAIVAAFITLFVISILCLLYKAMQIISKAYENKFQSKIAKPVFSVMAYSLIWMNLKQLIVFKFVVLTNPFLRDYLEIIMNLVYVVLVFAVLFKVMRDSQSEINKSKEVREKNKLDAQALIDRYKDERNL